MRWLRKELFRKFLSAQILFLIGAIAVNQFYPEWAQFTIIGLILTESICFFLLVTRPLKKVLKEFKALLVGKNYNRIYTEKKDEIGVMAHFFNGVTKSLERVTAQIKAHRRLSSELNTARKIQQDVIPQKAPEIPGLDIMAKTKPAAELGGDAYSFLPQNDQTFMYIGDVTGHGIPSGLVMMVVDTLIHTFIDQVRNGHELLSLTNKYLKPRIQTTMFMTLMMLRYEHHDQKLHYTGAGHETLLHYKAKEGICENIKGGGIALGMVPDNTKLIKETHLPVEEGDFIVLYTDGIVEAKNETGEMYSIEQFRKLVEEEAPKAQTAEELFNQLSTKVLHFLGDFTQEDDMTLLVIKKDARITVDENK